MLVLAIAEGGDFYVGHERFVVTQISSPKDFTVTRAGDGVSFDIVASRAAEVLPEVTVCAGTRGQGDLARVGIEADRRHRILRGDHYRVECALG